MAFQKKVENFTCEHCGAAVVGNGYTNHCPVCLWSKHVDLLTPGDRAAIAICGGLMKPMKVEMEKGRTMITQECVRCGHTKRNMLRSEDDITVAAQVQREFSVKAQESLPKGLV